MINFHRGSRTRKMLRICAIIFLCFAAAQADGGLKVLYAPSSITFRGNDVLKIDQLSDVLNAVTGKEISDTADWSALIIKDPFHLPTRTIVLHIDGVKEFVSDKPIFSCKVSGNDVASPLDVFKQANKKESCSVDFGNEENRLVQLEACVGQFIKPVIDGNTTLDPTDEVQNSILESIAAFTTYGEKIEHVLKGPHYSFLRIDLSPFTDQSSTKSDYVEDDFIEDETEDIDSKNNVNNTNPGKGKSAQLVGTGELMEAFKLINSVTKKIGSKLSSSEDRVLFLVVTSEISEVSDKVTPEKEKKSRKKREVISGSDKNQYNLATYYDQNYPVIFNIILWFMVAFGLSLLAICYAIADMDPGRDSIIYRMTSTRMKKDN